MAENKCIECGEQSQFFHSKCCGAHLECLITEKGELIVVCEKCKQYVGTLFDIRKDITVEDAQKLVQYICWLESKVEESGGSILEEFEKSRLSIDKLLSLAR